MQPQLSFRTGPIACRLRRCFGGILVSAALAALAASVASVASAHAQSERKSLLNSDPEVIYLEDVFERPLELELVREAPIFSDKEGRRTIGTLKAGQTVEIEAITERAYRVRGEGMSNRLVGWVGPWAFSSAKDPEFATHLKQLYARQMQVKALIEAKQIAIGMTLAEVSKVLGKPTKTSVRQSAQGQSGKWEYIEYDEVKHYATRIDPHSGLVYRQLVSVTQEVKESTVVEFENGHVTAMEESQSRNGGGLRITLPQLLCAW